MDKQLILKLFQEYDLFLSQVSKESRNEYHALFSLRTYYVLHGNFASKDRVRFLLMTFFKIIGGVLLYPFIDYQLSQRRKVIFLRSYEQIRFDTGDKIPSARIERKYSFLCRFQGWFSLIIEYAACVKKLFSCRGLHTDNILYVLSNLLNYLLVYRKIDMGNVKVLVAENDLYPPQIAAIQKAKDSGAKTIKIEESFIDTTNHNNIFCEYYFCPGEFYRRIRGRFIMNHGVKYIDGGIIGWDALSKYRHTPAEGARHILFICQHSGAVDEFRYIDDILSVTSTRDVLLIKVHPRDNLSRFQVYADNPRCKIVRHGDMSNYELISRVDYCFSVNSVLSVEAKHIMNYSFFINYSLPNDQEIFDYDLAKDYFDIITSREQLQAALNGRMELKELELCRQGFNMAYPHSREKFERLIDSFLNEGSAMAVAKTV